MHDSSIYLKLRLTLGTILVLVGLCLTFFVVGHSYLGLALAFFGILIFIYTWFRTARDKHPKLIRILKTILSIVLIIGTAYFAFLEVLIIRDARTDAEASPDYIIVLGAGVNGSTPSLSLTNRLNATLEYLEEHPDAIAIGSGGQGPGEDLTEAQCMYEWLTSHGIESERVVRECKATSTEENLRFSREIIESLGGEATETVGIVSSEYHLHRAKLMAEAAGFTDVAGIAAKTSYPTLAVNYFIREAFGLTHFYVFGF